MEARTEHPGKAKAQQKDEGWFGGQGGRSGTAPMAAFLPPLCWGPVPRQEPAGSVFQQSEELQSGMCPA